jgi:hypothetical protein
MNAATVRPPGHAGAHRRRRLGRLRDALQAFTGIEHAPTLLCGSPEPLEQIEPAWRMPYRCTGTDGHYGAHRVVIDGVIEAVWWA